jgi:hypothetical protein
MTDHEFQLLKLLDAKRLQHRQLDDTIDGLVKARPDAELEIIRLKKQKLVIRDEIIQLENMIYPNIPA